MTNNNYPIGAEHDKNAPWNKKETIFECGNTHPQGEDNCRLCEITGECITALGEGYIFGDGEAYFKNESDLLTHLKSEILEYQNESKEFILYDAYEIGLYYYTEFN